MSHNSNSHSDPTISLDDRKLEVKEKTGGTHAKRDFQIRLSGDLLLAMEKRAKRLGLRNDQYFRGLVEMDLVKSGYLPNWWYTRDKRVIH